MAFNGPAGGSFPENMAARGGEMDVYGADIDAPRTWGTRCGDAAGALERLCGPLSAQACREDIWTGPDADAFRSVVIGRVSPLFRSAEQALAAHGAETLAHADEQDVASSPDGESVHAALTAASAGMEMSASAIGGFLDHRGDERSARRGDGRGNSITRDGDDEHKPDGGNPNAQYSTPGPPETPAGGTGLGPGVPGTAAQAPEPPAWTPPADGAGEHNSEFAGLIDHSIHSLAREGADLKRDDWPHAAANLDHFLDNSGEDVAPDVDALLRDEPDVAAKAEERRHQAGADAVAQAKADGATGPVTYPLSTPWTGHTVPEGRDWFYASGSFTYNQTGTVTVYPPDADHPEWRYEVSTQVNFRDRYNWDGGKSTEIMGMTVTEESLAALHRAGIAREYNLVGNSSQQTTTGTA